MLYDEEAVLAGIDRWPLQPGEPEQIVRFARDAHPSDQEPDASRP
jgi:hypothetical protein